MKQLIPIISVIVFLLVLTIFVPVEMLVSQSRRKRLYSRLSSGNSDKILTSQKKLELLIKYSEIFYNVLKPINTQRNEKEMQRKILEAGLSGTLMPDHIFGMQTMCAFFVFAIYFLMVAASGFKPFMLLLLLAATVIGYIIPEYMIIQKCKSRKNKLTQELPFVLNTLSILTNAGLSLYEAICKASEGKGTLAGELKCVVEDVELGTSLQQALNASSERCRNREYSRFVFSVCQSMQKGNEGIVREMKRLSDEAWEERMNRAKENGSKISIKLLFPMLIFSFPAMMIIILGPALISLMKVI